MAPARSAILEEAKKANTSKYVAPSGKGCHLSVTQRYAHTTETRMREAVQVFGRRVG